MTVYRRGAIYWYDFVHKGRRIQRSTRQGNRRIAEQLEAVDRSRLSLTDAGITERAPAPLLSDFSKQFLADVEKDRHPRTVRRYRVSLVSLEKWLGSKRLNEISAESISQYKMKRLELGRAAATVNRDLACLRRILGMAVRLDRLSHSPFVDRKVEFLREQGSERILTFEEERRYLAGASPTLKDVAVLILETGLRPDEVFRIMERDIELDKRCMHVRSGKTKNARRDVFLSDAAREIVKRRIQCIPPDARDHHKAGPHLFPRYIGFVSDGTGHGSLATYDWSRPMSQIWNAHQEALISSCIQPPFRIYDLRHTYGTRAVEAGMDVLTLMRVMGHASLHTTNRYVHLTQQHLELAQKLLETYRAQRVMEAAEASARSQGTLSAQAQ
jgi:site-specific recombinase XerD